MFDPERPSDLSRLTASQEWSVKEMRFTREERMLMLRKLVGKHHKGAEGYAENRPVNMIELGVSTYRRMLASHTPQAMVTTEFEELMPTASDMEILLNRQVTESGLCDAFNTCTVEALFNIGVMVVGITTSDTPPTEDGYEFDPGHVFADPVLFPDLVLDMNARAWDQQSYIGHDFFVPLDWVSDNPDIPKEIRNRFTEQEMWRQRNDEDWERVNRVEFESTVRLRQTFIPRQQLIVITSPDHELRAPLQVIMWKGPKTGPYRRLSFGNVPGHILPSAPVQLWYDLDDIVNKCYSKTADQALRQKTIGITSDTDAAQTIMDTPDGHVAGGITDPSAVVEQSYGGPNREVLAMVQLSKQMLSQQAGNLEVLGGLAPQSGTLGQDQLLAAGASGRLKDMQQTVVEFQTGVVEDMAFWLWTDPVSQYRFTKKLDGTNYGIPVTWTPESKQGEFSQYNFKVNPYSLINRSPTEQAEALIQVLTNIMLPTLPYMQQGAPVDWEKFYKLLARYMHLPELNQVIKWPQGESIPPGTPEMPESPQKPPITTRNYVRHNRPGATQQGQQAALIQTLLGNKVQDSEAAAMMQPLA